MGIKNKLENAYYEIIAPEKQELISDANLLDKEIDNLSILQESINKLKEKINISQTGKQRETLEKQLEQLRNLHKLYLEYKKIKITKNTKNQIENLFKGISSQISLKKEQIQDDYKNIKKLIESEIKRLEDTIDILSYNTIRDMVEDNINIIGTYESIPPQKYQDFFDIITITYIDFIEEKFNKKLTGKQEQYLIKNKGFFLDKKEAAYFIQKLIKNLDKRYLNLKFFITLKKGQKQEKVKVDLQRFYEEFYKKQIPQKTNIVTKENTINKEQTYNNYDKLSTKEKLKYIEKILDKKENKELLLSVIQKLENKVIPIEGKKIKLTRNFINKNKEKLIHNLKILLLMIIHIESDGNYKAINLEGSSGNGLGQWLDGNGKYSTEYMYKEKWYTKNQIKKILKIEKINQLKKRIIRKTSSFETTLKKIYNGYPDSLLEKLSFNIPKNYNKKLIMKPLSLNLEQQIQLLILDIGINNKKVKNNLGQQVGIKDFLGTAILGNSWATKEIYKIFHHTKPNKKTLKRIKTISPLYTKRLIRIF